MERLHLTPDFAMTSLAPPSRGGRGSSTRRRRGENRGKDRTVALGHGGADPAWRQVGAGRGCRPGRRRLAAGRGPGAGRGLKAPRRRLLGTRRGAAVRPSAPARSPAPVAARCRCVPRWLRAPPVPASFGPESEFTAGVNFFSTVDFAVCLATTRNFPARAPVPVILNVHRCGPSHCLRPSGCCAGHCVARRTRDPGAWAADAKDLGEGTGGFFDSLMTSGSFTMMQVSLCPACSVCWSVAHAVSQRCALNPSQRAETEDLLPSMFPQSGSSRGAWANGSPSPRVPSRVCLRGEEGGGRP